MKANFVTFYSPGTFVSESDEQPIESWDVDEAVKRAGAIKQRHGARPYGFKFTRRGRGPDDLDSKEIAHSPMYYLGGRIETRAEVEARNDLKEHVLRFNMSINNIERVIINDNSYRSTFPFGGDDVLLDVTLPVLADA